MKKNEQDEIWLSHLRPNERKWITLAGDYPHTLVGVGTTLREAVDAAARDGYTDVTLFYVPPAGPLCVTPLLA